MKFELIRERSCEVPPSLLLVVTGMRADYRVTDSSNDNSNRFSITKGVILTD